MNVTVLLVIHNAEMYIEECINSVLLQSLKDFELLIIDDGSNDETINILRKYKDKRIRIISNSHDYISSLNLGLNESRGKYIARMDGDDIMEHTRLEKQIKIMESNADLTVCASWMKCFGLCDMNIDSYKGLIEIPLYQMILGNIISHPTTMIKRDFIRKNNIYYKNYPCAEDYKLWSDIAINNGSFYVIPEYLLYYRCSNDQISNKKKLIQEKSTIKIQKEIIQHILNKENNLEALQVYNRLLEIYDNGLLSFNTLRNNIYEILVNRYLRTTY